MTIQELLRTYDFHDSLLEKITYDKAAKKLILRIDLCNWQQEWYDAKMPETEEILFVFEKVNEVQIPKVNINSDEIINVSGKENGFGRFGIEFLLFNDVDRVAYAILAFADSVHIQHQ